MEMTVDIGKDVHFDLLKLAKSEDKPLDVMAIEMLSLGVRVHQASLNKDASFNENALTDEDKLRNILKMTLQNQQLISEVLGMVFDKDRSKMGAYDLDTALVFSEKMAENKIKGREML